ncbi:MAG: methylated-DNA--[protein]-cysteine S-methyltransferase [Vicinamibacterales bacterium]
MDSSSRFYERAAPLLGMTPSAYRAGAEGQTIRCASASTPLGRVLVAATAKGVCSVSLGDSERALLTSLRSEFPKAAIVRAAGDVRDWLARVVAHVNGRLPQLDLPLDIRATAFQWQVWNALRTIPPGETRTYRQVADAIGRPSAARAVARACASNPVALAVPCHRVVPSAGGSGGYRWGEARKARLIARERSVS